MKTIFVSSTFKDMHYERDAIRDATAPLLNTEAKKYGDEVDFCDLRWGINTGDLDTEEGSRKVLDVCLDEIDRSEPPMVVLLGYRYGWIPDAGLIRTAADRKHLELEDLERSVTALEIEYGSLCDERKFQNTLFYFRKIEGDAPSDYLAEDREHEEKVLALKNRIKSITGGKVREYTLKWNGSGFDGVNDFARSLAEDIKKILMHEWQETEKLTDFQRERRTHAAFIREKNVMFKARQAEAGKLMEDALSQPVTIIKGEVGSGKSTLFSHMATELGKSGWTVLPFISGLTTQSNSAGDIIENTVYFIEEELHLDHYMDETAPQTGKKKERTHDEWRDRLAEMCSVYAKTGAKLLIMVDAADQLTQSEERDKLHFIPMSVSEDIHFVMTCTTDFRTPGREHYTLRRLNDEDKLDVVNGILARCSREISKPVIDGMLELKASNNPLYLSLLVQRLLMMNREDFADIRTRGDGMAAIEQYQLELIRNKCPDGLDEMSAALLCEAGKRINEKLISKAAQYLAVSRNGLRRKDMAALLSEEWTEIDFSHFVSYMRDCFLLRDDGRYDFMHKSIRAGFCGQCEDLDEVNRELFEYFKSLEANDPVKMGEIIYHAITVDDKKFFVDYVTKSNPNIKSHTARDIYAQCITDNGQWITDVLYEAKKYEADEKLCNLTHFCNYDLIDAFLGRKLKPEIVLSILTANIDLSEYLYHKLKSNKSKWELSFSYDRAAGIYEQLGGRHNLKRALELYEKNLTIREQLAAELDTEESKTDLSFKYINAAKIYENLGGIHNLNRALELYGKNLTISEQLAAEPGTKKSKRRLSGSYYMVAGIYEELGGSDNLYRALELFKKSLTISEQLANELGTAESKRDLSLRYHGVAGIYEQLGGIHNLKLALDLHKKSLAISEQLETELNTEENKKNLSLSYFEVAGIYEQLGGIHNLKLALDLYEKSLAIREQLAKPALKIYEMGLMIPKRVMKDAGFTQSKWELSISYFKVAEIYEQLGGSDNLKLALELYEKSLMVFEQLEADPGTPQIKRDLSNRYFKVAGIYEALGSNDNLKRALELYEKSLKISEQPDAEFDISQNKMMHSISYIRIAGIYEQLGGNDNLQLALELYEKSLKISEQLEAELGTDQKNMVLSSSYDKIAKIYVTLGGSDNLKSALEFRKKSLTISERLDAVPDTAQNKMNLFIRYYNVAETYEALGGSDNLAWALKLYHKALAVSESLADTLQTPDAYDALAVCLLKIARHPSTSTSDKKTLLTRSLEISKELYEKTNLDKYKSYIDACEKLLSGC